MDKLKDLYQKLNKHVLHIRLSKKVDEKPINLHYMRSLKACIKQIKLLFNNSDETLIKALIDKAEALLVIKTVSEDNQEHEHTYTDIDGAAQDVNANRVVKSQHENEKSHNTKHENVQKHIKTSKGAATHKGNVEGRKTTRRGNHDK